jgi:hypothetical protein
LPLEVIPLSRHVLVARRVGKDHHLHDVADTHRLRLGHAVDHDPTFLQRDVVVPVLLWMVTQVLIGTHDVGPTVTPDDLDALDAGLLDADGSFLDRKDD